MARKKSIPKKTFAKKTTIIKIAEKVGEVAGRIMNEKDQLVEMAGSAIDSMKSAVKNITSKKKVAVKKAAIKKTGKKVVKKVAAKVVRPAVKKISKVASPKKVASVKKTVKKAVKKTIGKAAKKV